MQVTTIRPFIDPELLRAIGRWPRRRWIAATGAATLVALSIGVPTGVVPSSLYHRMTPTTWWDYPVWAVSAALAGLTLATYVRGPRNDLEPEPDRFTKRSLGATIFSALAVGCPICNKVVVALVGISGALNYWAPLQPLIGVLSVGLLSAGLLVRLRGETACPLPAT
jgi:hypothetical protein